MILFSWTEDRVLLQITRELKGVRRELDPTKADNVALVERLRYVQGYRAHKQVNGKLFQILPFLLCHFDYYASIFLNSA